MESTTAGLANKVLRVYPPLGWLNRSPTYTSNHKSIWAALTARELHNNSPAAAEYKHIQNTCESTMPHGISASGKGHRQNSDRA